MSGKRAGKKMVTIGGRASGMLRPVLMGAMLAALIILWAAAPAFAADPTYAPAVNYGTGTYPAIVTTGDFNADGITDLATSNMVSNTVTILMGNGNGTFAAQANYATGAYPASVATGDFNADGKTDLATANVNSDNVSILLGNGNGTFAAAVNYTVGADPYSVTSADFNADGITDVATANMAGNNVSILLGNGNGTFAAAVNYVTGSAPYSVTTGDFNADGITDLATANLTGNSASILLGNGNGTFAAPLNYAAGTFPVSVTTGDFNADGRTDLAIANLTGNNVSILLNTTTAPCTVAKPNLSLNAPSAFWGSYADYTARKLSATWTVRNNGTDIARNVLITSSTPTYAPVSSIPGWAAIGDIAAGGTGSTVIQYQMTTIGTGFRVLNTASAEDCSGTSYTYP
jgi:hypothetical protein